MTKYGTEILAALPLAMALVLSSATTLADAPKAMRIECKTHFYHGNTITSERYALTGTVQALPSGKLVGEVTAQDEKGSLGPLTIQEADWKLKDDTGARGYVMHYASGAMRRSQLILWEGREGHHVHSAQNAICTFTAIEE
jgi:hypothetical protein